MVNSTQLDRSSRLAWGCVALLLLWMVVVVTLSQWRMSATFDEQNHVTRGIAILRTGDFRLVIHHPPLANVLEALPVAWLPNGFSTAMPAWRQGANPHSIWPAAHQTIWTNPRHGVTLMRLARVPVLLFMLGLGLVIFLWSRELFGPWGGVLSLGLFALDPTVLAHSGLATTDIPAACTMVLAMYLLRRDLLLHSRWSFALAGIGIGLALATKFSALILFPILALTLLGFTVRPSTARSALSARWQGLSWGARFGRAVAHGLGLLVIAGIVVWGTYGFTVEGFGSKPGQPVAASASWLQRFPVPALQYFRGIKSVAKEKHPAYLLGQVKESGKGWWWYFPTAIATKTPIPALLLLVGILVVLAVPRLRARLAVPPRDLFLLLSPVVVFTLAAMGFLGISLNIGIRHILPLYPFLFILAGGWVVLAARTMRPVLAVALAAQCISVLWAYPDFIAYFNEAAVARQDGSQILVDSNYDWGQGLGQLAELQRRQHLYPLAFSYFGTTPPEAYGIRYTPVAGFSLMEEASPPDLRTFHGYLAVSVTDLMAGTGYSPAMDYRALRQMPIHARAGKTINIYYFP